ncbi:hypothetical protein GCM10010123_08630 [Pilimelia anulata]|uniref:Serine protease n=1 Tax=Pilimelia anulata TaxID=53371 RepID=A0A8J3F7R4_9ACTN|nr:hypothetical protein [Pilimelia anulata]GGJ81106.1 hypothetical protein GCM10010123_08630 [Pilimelia anulata]
MGPARVRAAAVLAGTALAVPGVAAAAPAPPAAPAVSAAGAPGSTAYLRARYGVSEREALRRLALQGTAPALDAELRRRFPDSYAGHRLDQAGGGVLVVHSTDPAGARAALAGRPGVRVDPARWSHAALDRERDRLDRAVNARGRAAEVGVDVAANRVLLLTRPDTPAGQRLAAPAVDPALVAVGRFDAGAPRSAAAGPPLCEVRACPAPLRGGMRLDVKRNRPAPAYPQDPTSPRANPDWGQCTVGFLGYAARTATEYVLTAGHCTVGPYLNDGGNPTLTFRRDLRDKPIGTEKGSFENGPVGQTSYPADYAFLPFADKSARDYWVKGPRNLVLSRCVPSSGPCAPRDVPIRSVRPFSAMAVGTVVCGTGTGDDSPSSGYVVNTGVVPGTRCGEIIALDTGIKSNICSRPGDSGGPLFTEADGAALGLLNNGTVTPHDGRPHPCPTDGTEWTIYSPLSTVLEHVKRQTAAELGEDYGFRVLTEK